MPALCYSLAHVQYSTIMRIETCSSKGLVEIIRHAIEARQKLVYELKLVDDKLVIDAV